MLNLHSTMFLLIPVSTQTQQAVPSIYIPLCFYLYYRLCNCFSNFLLDLHSTMFLLIQYLIQRAISVYEFTFHYVSTYTKPETGTSGIYHVFTFHYVSTYTIPTGGTVGAISLFTFHYVSTYTAARQENTGRMSKIYIPLCFYLYRTQLFYSDHPPAFTFHYVSTYTRRSVGGCVSDFNLHSTMFLLIRELFGDVQRIPRSIYIPLCFYLYPDETAWLKGRMKFTFHYVSTYTYAITSRTSASRIYIPLCFYLYERR